MTGYLRQVACALIGAAVGLAVAPGNAPSDSPAASYAAQHASDCERGGGSPETAAARDPQSANDRAYSGVVCAGYQQGRFDEMVSAARQAMGDER